MKLEKLTGKGMEYLYRSVDSGIIYFRRYTTRTGEVFKSLRTKDPAEAKRSRDQILSNGKPKPTPKLRQTALERYDLWVKRKESLNKSGNTITSIKASRNFFEDYFATMFPDEVTAEWWESVFIPETKFLRFKSEIVEGEFEENGKPKRIRKKLARKTSRKFHNDWKWISSFLKQLAADKVIPEQPKLINPDPPREEGKVYTDEEIENLLNFAQNENLRLAILMGITMGMRRGEIFGLKSDRISISSSAIRLKAEDTKTRKPRSFIMSGATAPKILDRAQAGPYIFPSGDDPNKPVHRDGFMTAWRNLKKITGVEGRFHFLRHTFLTKAFKAPGANAALICHYAGLSLAEAQRTYLHFTEEDTKVIAGLVRYE